MILTDKEMKRLVARLGKEKDIALAAEFGITRQRVSALRVGKGIPKYQSEFRDDNRVTTTAAITRKDDRDTKRAMKKTGEKSRSKYIRVAVRAMNKEVLKG